MTTELYKFCGFQEQLMKKTHCTGRISDETGQTRNAETSPTP